MIYIIHIFKGFSWVTIDIRNTHYSIWKKNYNFRIFQKNIWTSLKLIPLFLDHYQYLSEQIFHGFYKVNQFFLLLLVLKLCVHFWNFPKISGIFLDWSGAIKWKWQSLKLFLWSNNSSNLFSPNSLNPSLYTFEISSVSRPFITGRSLALYFLTFSAYFIKHSYIHIVLSCLSEVFVSPVWMKHCISYCALISYF